MDDDNDAGVINDLIKSVNDNISDINNISDLLDFWKEINRANKVINDARERIKVKTKNYLKEKKWTKYFDDKTKVSVSLTQIKKQSYDNTQLKLMLTDSQLAQITKITTYERLNIFTEEERERLNKIVRGPKTIKKNSKGKR